MPPPSLNFTPNSIEIRFFKINGATRRVIISVTEISPTSFKYFCSSGQGASALAEETPAWMPRAFRAHVSSLGAFSYWLLEVGRPRRPSRSRRPRRAMPHDIAGHNRWPRMPPTPPRRAPYHGWPARARDARNGHHGIDVAAHCRADAAHFSRQHEDFRYLRFAASASQRRRLH